MEMRDVLVKELLEAMKLDENIIAIDADLGSASRFNKIKDILPNQFLNVGIAEANMIGVAAGLSFLGKKPVVHTFSPFASRRCFDQLYISGGYAKQNIIIIGSDPGICASHNGGTHTSFEDVALYRMIPNSKIYSAADENQLSWLINEILPREGIQYVRINRKQMPIIYQNDEKFNLNMMKKIVDGEDILVIAYGETLKNAQEAVLKLKENNISATLLDAFCLKPIDYDSIINYSKGKRMIITIENHSINNGLGSMVAEIMSENNINSKLLRKGINEQFGQVGSIDFLREAYAIDTSSIYNKILNAYKLFE